VTQTATQTPAPAASAAPAAPQAGGQQTTSGEAQTDAQAQQQTQAQQTQPATHTTPTASQPAPSNAIPTVSPATPQPSPTAATTTAAPATEVPTRYGVTLDHAIETVKATVEMASRQGATTARIELSPPSLGTIRIQLQHTDDGVTARVLTDHAATADTLSQGGDDLRRAFQSAGINLLSLNIEARADGGSQTSDPGQTSGSSSSANSGATGSDEDADAGNPVQPTTSAPAGSALVNVLA
jgi:flagellar hook-length control protein FliK